MLLALIPQTRWCSKPLPMLNNHVYSLSLACWRKGEHILVSTFNFLLDRTGQYSTVCTTATVEYSLSGIVAGNTCRCVVCNTHVKISCILKMHGTSKNVPVISKSHFLVLGTSGAFGYTIKRFSNKKNIKQLRKSLDAGQKMSADGVQVWDLEVSAHRLPEDENEATASLSSSRFNTSSLRDASISDDYPSLFFSC